MRRFVAASFVAVLTACGSSPPTTPLPSSTPASVTASAGDGQQALPATPVPVNPAVIVKDASGSPVSGAVVTFAVDSGGGTVTGASVTTGSNGVAAVGGWTLGPAEGRNVLRVTVGALAPVRIVATATAAATVTYPAMSVGAGGGSVSINDPGPLHGFSLSLPGGAFPVPTDWTVSYGSNGALPAIEGVNPISPLLTISSSTGSYAKSPMTLTLPVKVPAGMIPMVVMRDPASGTMEVLFTHRINDSVVAATTAHLNAAHMMDTVAAAASIRRPSLRNGFGVQVFVTALSPEQLAASYDTHFRPGIDDWDFESMGTMQAPDGICTGISATAIFYYFFHRKQSGPLFGSFQFAKGFPETSIRGIRWASLVQSRVEADDFGPLNDFIKQIASGGNRDQDMYNVLKANMMITGQPQLIALSVAGPANAQVSDHSAIAWKTVGNTIYIADASFPGNLQTSITFSGSRFSPFVAPSHLGDAPVTYDEISTIGLTQEFDLNLLTADWSQVVDKTINADNFPAYPLHTNYGLARDTIWTDDTLTVWSECAGCQPALTSPLLPNANGSVVGFKEQHYSGTTKLWTAVSSDPTAYALGSVIDMTKSAVNSTGAFYARGETQIAPHGLLTEPGTGALTTNFVWLDWHLLFVIKLGVKITPVAPAQLVATPLDLTASISSGTPPDHITYQWDFGDGTAKVSKDDDPAVAHTYASIGTFTAKVVLLMADTKQPIATATTSVSIVAPYIDLTVSGNWANNTAPALGTYHFTDFNGGRLPNASLGVDALVGGYDRGHVFNHGGTVSGIEILLVIPTGSALHAGQTFTKFVTGPPIIGIGQFQLTTVVDLSDPDNSPEVAPGTSGTFTVTAITIEADGTGFFSYTFSVTNGSGGTISGSGVAPYK